MLFRRVSRIAISTCLMGCCVMVSASQQPFTPLSGAAITAAAGDSQPDNNPPAELRSAIKQKDIKKAIGLVADWQIHRSTGKFNQDWTYAPLYLGLLAVSSASGDRKYHDVVLEQSQKFQWKLWANRDLHADDEAIAQAYEKLYFEDKDPVRSADSRATFDRLVAHTDNPDEAFGGGATLCLWRPRDLQKCPRLPATRSSDLMSGA
jgi:unsaturated rhamnogalacturonyl hydrolase